MKSAVKCDGMCGRDATIAFGKLNLCDECTEENLEGDGWKPEQRLEDFVSVDRPLGDELL